MKDYNYEKYQELKESYYKEHPTYNGEVDDNKERYIDDALRWRASYNHENYPDGGGF
jgi:hypothetical protein